MRRGREREGVIERKRYRRSREKRMIIRLEGREGERMREKETKKRKERKDKKK